MIIWKTLRQGALLTALLVLCGCTNPTTQASLVLGGDVILARAGMPIFPALTSTYTPWGDVQKVNFSTDYLFSVNMESPLGKLIPDPGLLNLCTPIEQLMTLIEGRVTLLNQDNNHSHDCLDTVGVDQALNAEDINQLTSGGVTYHKFASGVVAAFISASEAEGPLQISGLSEKIQRLKENNNLVVVSLHWGEEYQSVPADYQVEIAHKLIESGADIIWGHHPHVLQKMEWYAPSSGSHAGLILYSLGNLLADQWQQPETLETALIEIQFNRKQIQRVKVFPLVMDQKTQKLGFATDRNILDSIISKLHINEVKRMGLKVLVYPEISPLD
jgi:hypothetical protein